MQKYNKATISAFEDKFDMGVARIVITLLALHVIISCNGKNDNKSPAVSHFELNLANSNKTILHSTASKLKELEEMSSEPRYMEKAKKWFPIANYIQLKTNDLVFVLEYIQSYKKDLTSDVARLFQKLRNYRDTILTYDLEMAGLVKSESGIIDKFSNLILKDTTQNETKLENIRSRDIDAALDLLKNDLLNMEYNLVMFCYNKCGIIDDSIETYSVIVGQNSEVLQPGSILNIRAGVGSFSKAGKPKIKIRNKEVPIRDEGFIDYDFQVSQMPGKYKIPVEIDFLDLSTGKRRNVLVEVEYSVVKPCRDELP